MAGAVVVAQEGPEELERMAEVRNRDHVHAGITPFKAVDPALRRLSRLFALAVLLALPRQRPSLTLAAPPYRSPLSSRIQEKAPKRTRIRLTPDQDSREGDAGREEKPPQ